MISTHDKLTQYNLKNIQRADYYDVLDLAHITMNYGYLFWSNKNPLD